jgi:UDP-GlcNAc:undecaprenyl-phosphate GlcNAc-1-phosphate transferase
MILFSTFLISTIITILLMPILINLACKMNLLDIPDSRKIHCDPIPRIGGVGMALGAVLPIILWAPMNKFIIAVLIGSGVLVIFGLIDDMKDIGFKMKFIGQIIAALLVILYGGLKIQSLGDFFPGEATLSNWISIPLTAIAIIAVTNAINLSDGLDGLAGGITLLTFLFIGYLAYLVKFQSFEVMSVAMVGAIFALLKYNTHPATVFMGDAGSQLLGFIAVTLSLAVTRLSPEISPILPLLIIGMPLVDTLSVMVQRVLEGRSPFKADKNHLHHKLMNLGFYHTESVIIIYILHAIMVCFAFIFRYKSDLFLLISFIMFASFIIFTIFLAEDRGWRMKRYPFIDKVIKGPLRKLREENVIIKISFKAVEIGFISILILTCFLPRKIPIYFSAFALVLLIALFIIWQFRPKGASIVVEIAIFLMIPFLVYLGQTGVYYLRETFLIKTYNFSYGILIFFVLLTLKFTRRHGFKTNPMDFLILIVAIVLPNLPDERIRHWHMGFIAAKIVVLFFTYEILKGELRINAKKLLYTGVMALMIISIRGFMG